MVDMGKVATGASALEAAKVAALERLLPRVETFKAFNENNKYERKASDSRHRGCIMIKEGEQSARGENHKDDNDDNDNDGAAIRLKYRRVTTNVNFG